MFLFLERYLDYVPLTRMMYHPAEQNNTMENLEEALKLAKQRIGALQSKNAARGAANRQNYNLVLEDNVLLMSKAYKSRAYSKLIP